jgi:hypothetical protein
MRSFVSPHHDRIAKLSEKLGSLQSSVATERVSKIDTIESRLVILEETQQDAAETLGKKFNSLKEEVASIKSSIDDERLAREKYINEKMREVRGMEESLVARLETEASARKDMENRLYR